MQASQPCMFCRYRKARIAACCAASDVSPAQQVDKNSVPSAPLPSGMTDLKSADADQQEAQAALA